MVSPHPDYSNDRDDFYGVDYLVSDLLSSK